MFVELDKAGLHLFGSILVVRVDLLNVRSR